MATALAHLAQLDEALALYTAVRAIPTDYSAGRRCLPEGAATSHDVGATWLLWRACDMLQRSSTEAAQVCDAFTAEFKIDLATPGAQPHGTVGRTPPVAQLCSARQLAAARTEPWRMSITVRGDAMIATHSTANALERPLSADETESCARGRRAGCCRVSGTA